ncbi:hypothetical protein SDC9_197755 [bioreactor metagenome]|uniref:Uncharacterized protein n=1 Tax=bioreactor metagenome TaxID=1076179 RepID=A0A645II26_9ZZZZ
MKTVAAALTPARAMVLPETICDIRVGRVRRSSLKTNCCVDVLFQTPWKVKIISVIQAGLTFGIMMVNSIWNSL